MKPFTAEPWISRDRYRSHGCWCPALCVANWSAAMILIRHHYNEVIMSAMAYQITSLMVVYSTIYSGADQRKHQSSASLAFVRGIHRWPMNSPRKGPVTRKMFPLDGVIICVWQSGCCLSWGRLSNSSTISETRIADIFVAPILIHVQVSSHINVNNSEINANMILYFLKTIQQAKG